MLTDVITVIKVFLCKSWLLILKRQLVSNMKQCVQIDINSVLFFSYVYNCTRTLSEGEDLRGQGAPFQGNISNV